MIVTLFTNLTIPSELYGQPSWSLKKDKNGIQVFTRKSAQSSLDEFKGVALIEATVAEIVELFKAVEKMPQWVPDCKSSELLVLAQYYQVHYTVTSAPWPLKDRDAYVQYHYYQTDDNGVKVVFQGLPDYEPEVPDYIRVPTIDGHWLLTPKSKTTTEVTYQVHAEPGGAIPHWLANTAAVDTPFDTLKNLRDFLERN